MSVSSNKINKNRIFNANRIRTFLISSIALISALLSIYAFFFNETRTDLEFQITGDLKVYDLNSESSKIDIFFNKKPLNKESENLRIINLKIINTGSEKILKSYYDDNDRLGLNLQNGVLLEKPELIRASNSYLNHNLKISTDSLNNIYFTKVILEPEEYFTIKLLIKHPIDSIYNIRPIGKIAGIKELKIVNQFIESEKEHGFLSFLNTTFRGGFYVHLTRFLAYGLIVILIFFGIILLAIKTQEKKEKNEKNASESNV